LNSNHSAFNINWQKSNYHIIFQGLAGKLLIVDRDIRSQSLMIIKLSTNDFSHTILNKNK